MLWSLILIVVVSLFLCACSAGDDTEEKNKESRDSQLYEDIKKSIVRLEIDKSAGSGIVWSIEDGKIIIVSSRHLIEQGDKPTVIVYDGTRFDAMTEGSSDISDVGFLSIEYENRENGTNDDILNKINAVCPRIYESYSIGDGVSSEEAVVRILSIWGKFIVGKIDDSKSDSLVIELEFPSLGTEVDE